MEKVLKHYPDPESIPDTNIARVSALSEEERKSSSLIYFVKPQFRTSRDDF